MQSIIVSDRDLTKLFQLQVHGSEQYICRISFPKYLATKLNKHSNLMVT